MTTTNRHFIAREAPRTMRACLVEQLDILREAIRLAPACGATLQTWYDDGANFEEFGDLDEDQREVLNYAWGYLVGAADHADITVMELIEAEGLSFNPGVAP